MPATFLCNFNSMLTTWLTSDDKNDFIPHKFTRVMENGGKSIYPMCIKTE